VPRWRSILCLVVALAILALRLDRQLIRLPFMDRALLSEAFTKKPDRLWPQFPQFIAGVRAHTQRGDSIAIITPSLDWDEGYSYAYYRASYLLAGREVLPVAMEDRKPRPENLKRAKYVAIWGRGAPPSPANVVWQGEGGFLLRQ
jgi:hypothetical protein